MLHDGVLPGISSQLCVDRYNISFKYVTMTEFILQKPVNPRSQGTTPHSPGERVFKHRPAHHHWMSTSENERPQRRQTVPAKVPSASNRGRRAGQHAFPLACKDATLSIHRGRGKKRQRDLLDPAMPEARKNCYTFFTSVRLA